MNRENSIDVALAFIRQINAHDVAALCDLMTGDHLFVDSLGARFQGKEPMRVGWTMYFDMVPDYEIVHDEVLSNGTTVVALGLARGTYAVGGKLLDENRWSAPGAWRAVVRDKLIAEWQVYDNDPIRKIMERV